MTCAFANASTVYEWTYNPALEPNGNWTDETHWIPTIGMPPPDAQGEAARLLSLTNHPNYVVTLDDDITIDWLSIETTEATLRLGNNTLSLKSDSGTSNRAVWNKGTIVADNGVGTIALDSDSGNITNESGALIRVDSGDTLNLSLKSGQLINAGTIRIGTGGAATTTLQLSTAASLSGGGQLQLQDDNARILAGSSIGLTNAADHTIHGRGELSAALTNNGMFRVDSGATMKLEHPTLTNNGTIQVGSGTSDTTFLQCDDDVTLSGSGELQMLDANAEISIGATGSLTNGASHKIIGRGAISAPLTNNGTVRVNTNQAMKLKNGVVVNDGTIELGTGVAGAPVLQFGANVALGGDGSIQMLDETASLIADGLGTLLNGQSHSIFGQGIINVPVVNFGEIRVEPGKVLRLLNPSLTNFGTIAIGYNELMTATLQFDTAVILQGTGGLEMRELGSVIAAGTSGSLTNLGNLTIIGRGTISAPLINEGLLRIHTDETIHIANSLLTNNDTFQVGYGTSATTALIFDTSALLTGSGVMNMLGDSCTIATADLVELTNDTGHMIRGRGSIPAFLTNNGQIRATGTGAVLDLNGFDKVNDGVLAADFGATLNIDVALLTNFDGQIIADRGTVTIPDTTTIEGGSFEARNGGELRVDGVIANTDDDWFAYGGLINLTSSADVATSGAIYVLADGALELYDDESVGAQLNSADIKIDRTGSIRVEPLCNVTLTDDLEFATTDETLWYWSHGANLFMSGGVETPGCLNPWASIEAGCQDMGSVEPTGADFTLGQLWLTQGAAVSLADNFDNGNRQSGNPEALYIWNLNLADDATLNLNGLALYVVTGGTVEQVLPCESCWGGGRVIDDLVFLAGDTNFDRVVDGNDIGPFANLIITETYECAADLNEDGFVNALDIAPFAAMIVNR
ncbi:MAG: hypothetical protein H6818_18955 [Phycisphaerales bacterium]|nr:hypothetical protein [Phycisphaerales bacterium]MCB9863828.1 hypothetical protein [Phycisphaerales bacterium]